MIYTHKQDESFDPEILRQELVAAIGADGWHLNTAGNTVEFVATTDLGNLNLECLINDTIADHFTNGPKRDHNKAILKQIADLEATQTPRRIREGGVWLASLEAQIATLRKQLQ